MLNQALERIIGVSVTAGIMIIIIILIKASLHFYGGRIKKSAFVLMWLVVFVRLAAPFSFEVTEDIAVFHPAQTIYDKVIPKSLVDDNYEINSSINQTQQNFIEVKLSEEKQIKPIMNFDGGILLVTVWVTVAAFLLIKLAIAYALYVKKVNKMDDLSIDNFKRIRRKIYLKRCVRIKLCENDGSPSVFGIFRPTIILPKKDIDNVEAILLHELVHIKNHDNFKKMFCEIITSIHWFNPLVWYARKSLHKDIELACDERVISRIGFEKKSQYAEAIFSFATQSKSNFNMLSNFGKNPLVGRIKNIKNMKSFSIKSPIICLAITTFLLMGAFSPVGNLGEQLLSYALEPTFVNVKLTENEDETVIDYTLKNEKIFYIIANSDKEGKIIAGYKIGIYNEKSMENIIIAEGSEVAIENSFHVTDKNIYYAVRNINGSVGSGILKCNSETGNSEILWQSNLTNVEDVRISGNEKYLGWHEIYKENEIIRDNLYIWDIENSEVKKIFKCNGNQNYLNILENCVTFQRDNPNTGKTEIVNYNLDVDEEIVIENLLKGKPYSAYGNKQFIVYKEAYIERAEIIVHNIDKKTTYKLQTKNGLWGINLICDKLILTGGSNEILEVDLNNFKVSNIEDKGNLGIGFYRTKVSEDSASSIQYSKDEKGQDFNRLFVAKLVKKEK